VVDGGPGADGRRGGPPSRRQLRLAGGSGHARTVRPRGRPVLPAKAAVSGSRGGVAVSGSRRQAARTAGSSSEGGVAVSRSRRLCGEFGAAGEDGVEKRRRGRAIEGKGLRAKSRTAG
jgi:hypothetical protein